MQNTITPTRQTFVKFIQQPERYPLQLQERDLEILRLIYQYRFARSDFITKLIKGSERNILKRLQKLFHQDYLDRIADRRIRTRSGSDKMVYALTRKGAELLSAELGLQVSKLNWAYKNRAVTDGYVKHALMINKFRTILTLACNADKGASFIFWKESRGTGKNIDRKLSGNVTVELGQGRAQKIRIVPDAFLKLEDPNYEHFLYLEADRSTMATHRFLRKLKGYWTWWKDKGCQQKHGIEHFRVLTITQSHQRRDNLKRTAIKANPGRGGSGMFWFACQKDFTLEDPASIFKPIWLTAKDNKLHSLLE